MKGPPFTLIAVIRVRARVSGTHVHVIVRSRARNLGAWKRAGMVSLSARGDATLTRTDRGFASGMIIYGWYDAFPDVN